VTFTAQITSQPPRTLPSPLTLGVNLTYGAGGGV
jgi:hypothetical protein